MSAVDQIKERLDVVSVVSDYVTLTKAGRNFKARCPFHQERTPSFYVFPQTQTWRCFGACATGGDLFSFVMRQQGVEFGGALRLLAQKAGVVLEERPRNPEAEQRSNRLLEANQAAALFYHHQLLNSPEAAPVRSYVDQRGISKEMVDAFVLGYSPQPRDSLSSYLESRSFTTEELLEAGLVMEGNSGLVDRFWGRLMFPIWNASGMVVGFGGRTLGDAMPKYLNSSQTPLFDKGGILYALHRAQEGIRKERQAVIVEGYMDALMAHQYGFSNVVASMGTSITEAQVQLLSRYTNSLVLALDPDAAGQTATLRSLETAPAAMGEEVVPVPQWRGRVRWKQQGGRPVITGLPQGTISLVSKHKGDIKVLELPPGKDPDELIRTDPRQWPELVAKSVPMMDFVLKAASQRLDLTSPRGKAQAAEEVLPFIAELSSPVEQSHYLQRLADMVGVDERTLRSTFPAKRQTRRQAASGAPETDLPTGQAGLQAHFDRTQTLEDYCLALLLRYHHLRGQAASLRPEHFLSTESRAIFSTWQQHPEEELETILDSTLLPRFQEIGEMTLPPATEMQATMALAQCIRRLEERRLRDLKLHHQLRFAQHEPVVSNLTMLSDKQWQESEQAVETPIPSEPVEGLEPSSAEAPEEELRVNQELQQLMLQNTLRRRKSRATPVPNENPEPEQRETTVP